EAVIRGVVECGRRGAWRQPLAPFDVRPRGSGRCAVGSAPADLRCYREPCVICDRFEREAGARPPRDARVDHDVTRVWRTSENLARPMWRSSIGCTTDSTAETRTQQRQELALPQKIVANGA